MKRIPLSFLCAAGVALALFSNAYAQTQEGARLTAGCTLESLTVGNVTYQHVTVRSISPRSVMITHDGGMKSLLLRELSPELQQRFGYNPEADKAQEAKAQAGQAAAAQHQKAREQAAAKSHPGPAPSGRIQNKIDQLLRSFGQAPEVLPNVDLRPRFAELGLWVKDQGHRPSCAVFAIVSALEFQSAEVNGSPERYSEEYLYWATSKTLNRLSASDETEGASVSENMYDIGFSLPDVVSALRAYGIPPRDRMPNQLAGNKFPTPSEELIEEARQANRTSVHIIPGNDQKARVANIIHALNLGLPVPIGIRWPDTRVWRVHYLDKQQATLNSGHAITLVGYECPSGNIEEAVFRFKNSWGPLWGEGGYGYVTYHYLSEHLGIAIVLEVQPK